MSNEFLTIEGLESLERALREIEPAFHLALKEGLRAGGKIVEADARKRFQGFSRKTADGFRTYVRAGGLVQVEQSLRKTTGLHPEWGSLQMTEGLLPAREERLDDVAALVEVQVGALLHRHGF